jgi:hypothetical protein
MRIFKIVIGSLAALLAFIKLLSLASILITGDYSHVPQPVGSWMGGSIAGIMIFLAIAILCFRRKKL